MTTPSVDPATLMLAASLTGYLSAGFSFMAARAFAGMGDSARNWGYGMVTLATASLLWFLAPHAPRWLGFALANGLAVVAPALLLSAIYRFEGEQPPRALLVGLCVLGGSGIAVAYGLQGPTAYAVLSIALAQLCMVGLGCWRLFWRWRHTRSSHGLVLFLVLLIVGLATTSRLLVLLLGDGAEAVAPTANSLTQIVAIGVVALLVVAGSFGFLGMVAEQSRSLILEHASRDALTGLLTRGAFCEQAEQMLAHSSTSTVVMMLDIDRFKRINDTHGHLAGDAVIRHAARLIQRNSRGNDVVGRYGGEEFCVVLPHCGATEGRLIAERFVQEAAQQAARLPNGQSILWTLSVGYVVVDGEALSSTCRLDDLVESADQALYEAKRGGRNRAVQAQRSWVPFLPSQKPAIDTQY